MTQKTVLKPTHLYKGKPVEYAGATYVSAGQQYCTIVMVNKDGKNQRQTIQLRHLTPLAPDKSGDSATQPGLSKPECFTGQAVLF